MHRLLICLHLCPLALAQQSWPGSFQPGPTHGQTVSLEWDGKAHRYQTKHFIVESPSPLNRTLVGEFAKTVESVPVILKKIPLPLFSPPRDSRARIRLFSNDEAFIKAGGPIGAAGFYSGKHRHVILRSEYFLSEEGRARPNHDLLIHELTHLCMHEHLWKYRPWFYEGVAEYLAAAHSRAGNFRFSQITTAIKDHVISRSPPGKDNIAVTRLTDLVELTSSDWTRRISKLEGFEVLESYSAALLLIHYHFHGGPERRKELKNYLHAVAEIKDFRQPSPRLVTKENAALIQGKLKRYWAPRGLRLKFR